MCEIYKRGTDSFVSSFSFSLKMLGKHKGYAGSLYLSIVEKLHRFCMMNGVGGVDAYLQIRDIYRDYCQKEGIRPVVSPYYGDDRF